MVLKHRTALALVLAANIVAALAGCGQTLAPSAKKAKPAAAKHASWWCKEHGVPEHLCSLCSDDVAARCKKEGDWCAVHDRAQSQCFKCDPTKYDRFAAMYEAKYGEKPPRPPEEEFQK